MKRKKVNKLLADCETEYGWNIHDINRILDKIYADHKAEVKALKKRISDLEWKVDSQRCGGVR